MHKRVTDFFSSGLGLLITGFILTTVCGSIINGCHNSSTWTRDKNFELFKGQVAKHDELLTDLSKTMGARVFRVQRFLWNLDRPNSEPPAEMWTLKKEAKDKVDPLWEEYYKTVIAWNLNYRDHKRRIQLLAGDKLADDFFVPGAQGAQTAGAGSICGSFEQLHVKINALRNKARDPGVVERAEHDSAQAEISQLYNKIDDYMAHLSKTFEAQDKSGNPLKLGPSKN